MELVCENAKEFGRIVNTMSNIVSEITFVITDSGLTARAIDPSHISMISVDFPRVMFEQFKITEDCEIGIDLDMLKKVINRAKQGDKLILKLNEYGNKLDVILKNGSYDRKFKLSLYDLQGSSLKVPDIEYPNTLTINAKSFIEALKDVELNSWNVTLKMTKQKFIIEGKGDLHNTEVTYTNDNEQIKEFKWDTNVKSTFKLDYLKNAIKELKNEEMIVKLGIDMPVLIKFNMGGSVITYLQAPIIEH